MPRDQIRRTRPVIRWRRLALWSATIVGLAVAPFPMAGKIGAFLAASDPPAPSDATFLTYGVNSFARPQARQFALNIAITRYNSGDGPHVLLSEWQDADASFTTRISRARNWLTKGGVPESAIAVLPPVANEYEEGEALREAITGRGWTRVVAYAPAFRARRTRGTLRHAGAAAGVEVRVIAVGDSDLRLERWWETGEGVSTVLNEYPRLFYYFLRGRL